MSQSKKRTDLSKMRTRSENLVVNKIAATPPSHLHTKSNDLGSTEGPTQSSPLGEKLKLNAIRNSMFWLLESEKSYAHHMKIFQKAFIYTDTGTDRVFNSLFDQYLRRIEVTEARDILGGFTSKYYAMFEEIFSKMTSLSVELVKAMERLVMNTKKNKEINLKSICNILNKLHKVYQAYIIFWNGACNTIDGWVHSESRFVLLLRFSGDQFYLSANIDIDELVEELLDHSYDPDVKFPKNIFNQLFKEANILEKLISLPLLRILNYRKVFDSLVSQVSEGNLRYVKMTQGLYQGLCTSIEYQCKQIEKLIDISGKLPKNVANKFIRVYRRILKQDNIVWLPSKKKKYAIMCNDILVLLPHDFPTTARAKTCKVVPIVNDINCKIADKKCEFANPFGWSLWKWQCKSVNSAKSWKFCFMKAKKFVEVSQQLLSNSYPFPVSVISGMLQQAKFFQQIGDSQYATPRRLDYYTPSDILSSMLPHTRLEEVKIIEMPPLPCLPSQKLNLSAIVGDRSAPLSPTSLPPLLGAVGLIPDPFDSQNQTPERPSDSEGDPFSIASPDCLPTESTDSAIQRDDQESSGAQSKTPSKFIPDPFHISSPPLLHDKAEVEPVLNDIGNVGDQAKPATAEAAVADPSEASRNEQDAPKEQQTDQKAREAETSKLQVENTNKNEEKEKEGAGGGAGAGGGGIGGETRPRFGGVNTTLSYSTPEPCTKRASIFVEAQVPPVIARKRASISDVDGGWVLLDPSTHYTAENMKSLLDDYVGRNYFSIFLEENFCDENLKFWEAAMDFKQNPSKDLANSISADFVQADAPYEVNLDVVVKVEIFTKIKNSDVDGTLFDKALDSIFILLLNDVFPRFLKSNSFKDYIQIVKNCENKKKKEKKKKRFSIFRFK